MLRVERNGPVLVLTLDRPEVRNAISAELGEAIAGAVEAAGDDASTSVVVVRGSGSGFSAGYEVTGGYGVRDLEENTEHLRRVSRRWERVLHSPLPVIAQVHGHCLAGGTDLATHCDLVVVADDARIGFPAVRSMGVPLTQMWLYHVGPQWAKRLLLTGDTMTGKLAREIGFALMSVPEPELEAETMRLAHRLALVPREMLIANKRVINHGLDLMGREALQDFAARQDALAHTTPPAQAFAAKARADGLKAAVRERDEPFGTDPLDVGQ
jgi:enoyl-CoA hydratase